MAVPLLATKLYTPPPRLDPVPWPRLHQRLSDARFREAARIDDQITKRGLRYMGYALIVGRKPGEHREVV
jgi:hypothetical protein